MKKLLQWLKSPKSDFVLFVIFLVLLNIVGHRAFVRFDLTAPKSYSLSKASKTVVKNLDTPLSVRVFFSDGLPSTYANVYQYVKDILVEYKGAANKNFSVSYMDMSKPENEELARDLGIQQVQIQEIKNNEVGLKQAYMGVAIAYGDNIEIMNPVQTSDGFEFNLTSKISKMISMADSLAGLGKNEKISLTLYLSEDLKNLGISGAEEAEGIIRSAYNVINRQNLDRIDYKVVSPSTEEADALSAKYGIQNISYTERGVQKKAAVGLILEHGEKFYALPLAVQRSFFGYALSGLDDVETTLNEGLHSLFSNTKKIGYITGHGEVDHTAEDQAANFEKLISASYELKDIDLNSEDIPAGMNSIIINGPKQDFTEEELYKIDQFLLRGGDLMIFIDGTVDDGKNQMYGLGNYVANNNNLDRLLAKYGIEHSKNMIMDKNCITDMNAQYGELHYWWVPTLHKKQLAKKNIITNNLGYVYMLQSSSLDPADALENKNLKVTELAKSSEEAWAMEDGITLHPLYLEAPEDASSLKQFDLALLLEGKFDSAFDEVPEGINRAAENAEKSENAEGPESASLVTSNFVKSSVLPGKLFVAGSSMITTRQVIDENGNSPVAIFLMNVLDYMNGNEDLCTMRTKSLSVNNLTIKSKTGANFWKLFNSFGIAIFVVIAGLIIWRLRSLRRHAINKKYNPDDTRTITK
ncbi:GldG family protein [Treponema bryantii]|uniref:GldG family protein n=1 Tax=Treponema bryantii TaxID=163 RepID=UPI0003B5367E|nr:Gldg family protein [Treponema bryantii]